jgi:hypothetical protein
MDERDKNTPPPAPPPGWFDDADNPPDPRPDAEAEFLASLDARIAGPNPQSLRLVPRPHPATLAEHDLRAQCRMSKGRSGGPGGQNRNKVETLVRFEHTATGVQRHAGERRSAIENERVALRRLRLALAVAVRCDVPAGDARSDLWKQRCQPRGKEGGRIAVSERHDDFPSLLAEALDILRACGWDQAKAAARLCCTPSQLLKLLSMYPPAMHLLNASRAACGLRPLRSPRS